MLAQLLGKEGMASRVSPHAATGRGAIAALDVNRVAAVCVTYLTLSGNPSHLRYLLRRLRAHLPRDVPVFIGLWPEGAEVLHDQRLRAAFGASDYTSSLRDAVKACRSALGVTVIAPTPLPVAGPA